jgi:hypothetical protein
MKLIIKISKFNIEIKGEYTNYLILFNVINKDLKV